MKHDAALLVIDVQNAFVQGGSMPVPNGLEVIPVINRLMPLFSHVILTQDWHPLGHHSFASSHANKQPFQTTQLFYGEQVLWPDHCVQGSADAQLHADLDTQAATMILKKGLNPAVDSYSAFVHADRVSKTGLSGFLKERKVSTVYVCGLATDFCVAWTALDACEAGFTTYVIEDACQAIDLNGSLDAAWQAMIAKGVHRTSAQAVRDARAANKA